MMLFYLFAAWAVCWMGSTALALYTGKRISLNNFSACGLINIASTEVDECVDSEGGITDIYVVDCDDCPVESMAVDGDGCITGLGGAGKLVKLTPADNDSAFYNQEMTRDGNKTTVTQTAFLQFEGASKEKVKLGNAIKGCCCLYAFVCFTNGLIAAMGIDYDQNTGELKKSKTRLRAVASLFSDTGDNADRLEITLEAEGRCLAPATTLTKADLDALLIAPPTP